MDKFSLGMRACGVFLLITAVAVSLPMQTTAIAPPVTLTTLHSFDYADGDLPIAGLIQGTDGKFYGTTVYGGANNTCFENACGTVFSITTGGTLMTLHSFDGTDGANPYGGLIQGTDGKFYGTTTNDGPYQSGTVFSITANGTLTTLHNFGDTAGDGGHPYADLVQGTDGRFYGTTLEGGANLHGTVFSITANGTLKTLHSFDAADGEYSYDRLVQGTDGNFYGTTSAYGSASCDQTDGCGTVFKITPGGKLTTLHSFAGYPTEGAHPYAGVVQGTDGKFYGTTEIGGSNCGQIAGCGTVFSITAGGILTTLHSFGSRDSTPYAGLVQATNGDFYGATARKTFKITPGGTLTMLYDSGTDAALVQGTDGKLYGTNGYAGIYSDGTVFSLSVGLGPFVETQPTSGNVGQAVNILGTNLTGATSITFNGTAATFTVISKSLITTTVPVGATTGTVQVVTPGGTLSSNVPFTVTP